MLLVILNLLSCFWFHTQIFPKLISVLTLTSIILFGFIHFSSIQIFFLFHISWNPKWCNYTCCWSNIDHTFRFTFFLFLVCDSFLKLVWIKILRITLLSIVRLSYKHWSNIYNYLSSLPSHLKSSNHFN